MAELTPLNVGQGETFKMLLTLIENNQSTPVDITEYAISGQVRENYTTDEIAVQFGITKMAPYSSGSFVVELAPGQTLQLTERKYVYDIIATAGVFADNTCRILEGPFTVRPAVTRY